MSLRPPTPQALSWQMGIITRRRVPLWALRRRRRHPRQAHPPCKARDSLRMLQKAWSLQRHRSPCRSARQVGHCNLQGFAKVS